MEQSPYPKNKSDGGVLEMSCKGAETVKQHITSSGDPEAELAKRSSQVGRDVSSGG